MESGKKIKGVAEKEDNVEGEVWSVEGRSLGKDEDSVRCGECREIGKG